MADTFEDLKLSLAKVLPQLQEAAILQAQAALQDLAAASEDAGKKGYEILQIMADVGDKLLRGQITRPAADIAMDNYLTSLALLAGSIKNAAAMQAFERGKILLSTLKDILLAVAQVALQVAFAQAGGLAGGLIASIMPKPPTVTITPVV